eukprot:TRINITY_DN6609_c0_g1_i2.p1 TRINITY_DN6609_c0_g1~~TRINITY_DN6609_c0_g1_i2.p1  ORF type:complete len:1318 (+),score=432.27 TRINITY_DN6609_c0_g1_i2:60-4013(+)
MSNSKEKEKKFYQIKTQNMNLINSLSLDNLNNFSSEQLISSLMKDKFMSREEALEIANELFYGGYIMAIEENLSKFSEDERTKYKFNPKYKKTNSISSLKKFFPGKKKENSDDSLKIKIKNNNNNKTPPSPTIGSPMNSPTLSGSPANNKNHLDRFRKSNKEKRKSKTSSQIFIYIDDDSQISKENFNFNDYPTLKTEITIDDLYEELISDKTLYDDSEEKNMIRGVKLMKKIKKSYTYKNGMFKARPEEFAQMLITFKHLQKVKAINQDFDQKHDTYRFSSHQYPFILNMWRAPMVQKEYAPLEFSCILYNQANDVLNLFESQNDTTCEEIKFSDVYRKFARNVLQLQKIKVDTLCNYKEKTAFWINVYNTLLIHGRIVLYTYNWNEIFENLDGMSYNIGENIFSLNEIFHGLLRGNRSFYPSNIKPFQEGDRRVKLCNTEPLDPRIHFSLITSFEKRYDFCLTEKNLENSFVDQTKQAMTSVKHLSNKVVLPLSMNLYRDDFGETNEQVSKFILNYISEKDNKQLYNYIRDNDNIFSSQHDSLLSLTKSSIEDLRRSANRKFDTDPLSNTFSKSISKLSPRHSETHKKSPRNNPSVSPRTPISPPKVFIIQDNRRMHSPIQEIANSSSSQEDEVFQMDLSPSNSNINSPSRSPRRSNNEDVLTSDEDSEPKVISRHSENYRIRAPLPRSNSPRANRRHSFTEPKTPSINGTSPNNKPISDILRKKLLSQGLFSANPKEKIMLGNLGKGRSTTNFLTQENLSKLSDTEISEVVEHQRKRNEEMERKCAELEKENDKEYKNTYTQQFNIFDLKKKILSIIEDFKLKSGRLSNFDDQIDLLNYQNESCIDFFKSKQSKKTESYKVSCMNFFEVNDNNLTSQHQDIVSILSSRIPPQLLKLHVFSKDSSVRSKELELKDITDEDFLVLILTSKVLRSSFAEALQKSHSDIYLKFWVEMHYLSKQHLSPFVLKDRMKEFKITYFQTSSPTQISLYEHQKKWEMIWESAEKNLLDSNNPILKSFVENMKSHTQNQLSQSVRNFISTYIPENKKKIDRFDGIVALIASGERDFLFDVTQYEKHFYQGLLSKCKLSSWIQSSQVEMFGSFDKFITLHKSLLSKIQKMQMQTIENRNIGEVFLSFKDDFEAYIKYAENFSSRIDLLFDMLHTNKKFSTFVSKLEKSEMNGTKLITILMFPFEMLNRYHICFTLILERLPKRFNQIEEQMRDACEMFESLMEQFRNRMVKGDLVRKLNEVDISINEGNSLNQKLCICTEGRRFIEFFMIEVRENSKQDLPPPNNSGSAPNTPLPQLRRHQNLLLQ